MFILDGSLSEDIDGLKSDIKRISPEVSSLTTKLSNYDSDIHLPNNLFDTPKGNYSLHYKAIINEEIYISDDLYSTYDSFELSGLGFHTTNGRQYKSMLYGYKDRKKNILMK